MCLVVLAWPAWLIVGAPFIAERLRTAFAPHVLIGAVVAAAVATGAGTYHGRMKRR
jgi:hypothetical protein